MTDQKPKKSRWLLWVTIGCFFLMLSSPVALYRLSNRAAFNRRVEQLAADGFPVSLDDLQAAYVLPEGQPNAADLYLKAFAAYVEPNEIERERLPIRGNYVPAENEPPYPDDILMAIKGSLDKNRECLNLLDQARQIDYCLFPRIRKKVWFSVECLAELRHAMMLLAQRNLVLAQEERTDQLYESLQSCFALSQSLSQQPQLIEHLVTNSMESILVDSLENCLNLMEFPEDKCYELQQQLHNLSQRNSYASGLLCERAGVIELMNAPVREVKEYYGFESPHNILFVLYCISGLNDKDALVLLDFYERQINILKLPWHTQLAEVEKLETEIQSYPYYRYGISMMAPAFMGITKNNLRDIGKLECAETALAIERYRLKYRSLPDSLDALVPEFMEAVYLDPFDGKPLRYLLRDTGGYTVYCIGADGIDNGGLSQEQLSGASGSPKQFDYTFTVKH